MKKPTFKTLVSQLDMKPGRRVPLVHQTESSECGLACLAMICGHYGKNIDLLSLRQQFNLSARGTTLSGLTGIAGQLGLATRPLSLDLDEIGALKMPCVLHWDFNHFVVLVSARRNRFVLHDPARGRRTVSLAEMSQYFTGVALEVWPGSEFTAETVKNRVSLRTLIRSVHGLKGTLGKIFGLSLVIETINLVMPVGTQLVMDHAIPAGDRGLLTLICAGLLFFILLRTAVSMVRAWSSLVMGTLINVQWQSGLFNHLLRPAAGLYSVPFRIAGCAAQHLHKQRGRGDHGRHHGHWRAGDDGVVRRGANLGRDRLYHPVRTAPTPDL